MAFSTDYSNVKEGSDLLPEGAYECIITLAASSSTKSGISCFEIHFVIRNDVSQSYGNRIIFHSMFRKKEPIEADNAVDGFSYAQIMKLAKSAELPSGKNYASLDDMGKDLVGKCVLVTTYHDPYKGKMNSRVKYIDKTKFPECHHKMKDSSDNNCSTKPPEQKHTASSSAVVPPASTLSKDLSDFKEIIGDDDLPF